MPFTRPSATVAAPVLHVLAHIWPNQSAFACMQATYISLAGNQLAGTISKLPPVTFLDLSSNKLSGQIFDRLPRKLQVAKLSNNLLSGPLPRSGLPANLSWLDASHNLWSGGIAPYLGPQHQCVQRVLQQLQRQCAKQLE